LKVLVTGASGHVGGAIARALDDGNHAVLGLARRENPSLPAGIRQYACDLAADRVESLADRIPRCDAIVHAAACLQFDDDEALVATNVGGTNTIARLAARWECSHLIYISTVAVYGRPGDAPLSESSATYPLNLYGATKLFGEHRVAMIGSETHALSLRIPSPIGPGMDHGRLVGMFIDRALAGEPLTLHGAGGRKQNYLDARDVAQAVVSALDRSCRGVVLLGAQASISNQDLAACIIETTGSASRTAFSGEPDPDEALDWSLDCRRAGEWLDWSPAYRLKDSIRDMAHARAT